MEALTQLIQKGFTNFGPFFILLGLLIFVHELGHYLVAVYYGVRVETFSLGFGKKIFSHKRGDTTYCLSIIPLGGYVKMYGDDPSADIPADQKQFSFLHKPVWPRMAIVLAGPLMNLFFAILVFAAVALLGEEVQGPQLGDILPNTAAYTLGFRSGDTIAAIDNQKIVQWKDAKELIENSADKELKFKVLREGTKEEISVNATPHLMKNDFLFTTDRQVGKIEGLSLESLSTMVGVLNPDSPAGRAGLKTLDIVEEVDGSPVLYWRDLEKIFAQKKTSWVLSVHAYSEKSEKAANTPNRKIELSLPADAMTEDVITALGFVRSDLYFLGVQPNTPAAKAGMLSGDRVTHIDGVALRTWQDVLDRVKSYKPEQQKLNFTLQREGKSLEFSVTPEQIELPTEQGAMEKRYAIGVRPAIMLAPSASVISKTSNPFSAILTGIIQSIETSKMIAISVVRLIQGEVSAKNVGGIITIGRVASKSFEVGIVYFLKTMAMISINLFLLNLLPIPVLDGGHILFFSFEAIKGSPISFRSMELAQQVGLMLLLALMMFALYNDFSHLISSW